MKKYQENAFWKMSVFTEYNLYISYLIKDLIINYVHCGDPNFIGSG